MNQIRLDDVLAREAAVQWFEGVAVLQLICRTLRTSGSGNSSFPNASDVVLGPGGSVGVTGASAGSAVQAAAHLLSRMLSDDVPVRLRLMVSQATGTEGAYAGLVEFSEALTYFERPNPEAIVEALRERAMRSAVRAVAAAPALLDTATDDKKRAAPAATVPPRRLNRPAVFAAAVAAVACASVWVLGRVQSPAAAAAPIERSAEVPPPARGRHAHLVSKAVTVRSASPVSGARPATVGEAASAVPPLEQLASYGYRKPARLVDASALPLMVTTLSMPSPSRSADEVEADVDRIYTQTDADVTLPLNVYPKFPTPPPASPVSSQAVLELTIGRDGLVEQVKMLSSPRSIHEFMLLSAAKAWRFEPARVGGRAVRFRHTLSIGGALEARRGTRALLWHKE